MMLPKQSPAVTTLLVIEPLVSFGSVRFGMTIDQIKGILGEPQQVTGNRAYEYRDRGIAILANRSEVVNVVLCGDMSLPNSPLIGVPGSKCVCIFPNLYNFQEPR